MITPRNRGLPRCAPPSHDSTGTPNERSPQIPGFTYLQHLGSGGFADVYLYEQEWPQQRVAVKVVRADLALSDHEKSLFTSEANAMARLADHPYIVDVITAGVTDAEQGGRPYLVMRYCPPPDLGARVRAQPMSVPEAISTGIKLASAVETAHRSGIVHRDIKPSNVLVTTYQEPALTDFGIAGHLSEIDQDAEVRISYPWSPPELVDGQSNGSVASDVYSLGATIWNLLTGRSPFAIPGRRQLLAEPDHPGAPRHPAATPATRRAGGPRPAAPALPRQAARAAAAERPRAGPGAAADRVRVRLCADADRGRRRPTGRRRTRPAPGEEATALKPVSIEATGPVVPSPPSRPGGATPARRPAVRSSGRWWPASC